MNSPAASATSPQHFPAEPPEDLDGDFFANALEHMFNGVAYCQMLYLNGMADDFVFLYANPAFSLQTGLGQVVGRRGSEIIPGIREADPQLFDIFAGVARGGSPQRTDAFVESLQQWFSLHVYSPRPACFVAVFDVITEQKQREAELQRTQDCLSLSQRSTGSGTWEWDIASGDVVWSRELFHMLGLDPAATPASLETWHDLVHPQDVQFAEARLSEALRDHVPLFSEYRIVWPSGEIRWIGAFGNTSYDATGQPVRMTGICVDITVSKQAAAERRRGAERRQIQRGDTQLSEADKLRMLNEIQAQQVVLEMKNEAWRDLYTDTHEALEKVTALKNNLHQIVVDRTTDLIIADKRAEDDGRLHSAVLENMASGVHLTRTSDARIMLTNSTFERMFGYGPGELLGKNVSCLNAPGNASPEATAEAINAALHNEGTWRGELLNIRKDGSTLWCRVNISTFEHANFGQVWLSVHTDISELMRAERRLRESEMRWQFAVESHGDAMWDWDVERDRLFLTPAAKELFNLTHHDTELPIAALIARIYDEDQLAMYRQIDDMIIGKTSEWSGECRLFSPNTATRWIATRGRVMTRSADGQPQSIVCISRDFTKQRAQEAEARLQSQRIAHQGRLVLLGELASALAHEINQPLTVITGLAAECKRKTENIPEALELIDTVEAQAIRAGEIVWRMLGFARRQRSGRSALSLSEVVNGVAKWIRADIGHYSAIIDTAGVAHNLPKVDANRVELEQVLLNLVRNGIEAGLPNTREQRIAIAGHLGEHPERLEVTVTDWGCGLPNAADFNAFQPFTSTKKEGVGLGLSICFSIVEAHGGHIWATPNPEGGTVFHFTLPIHQAAEKDPVEDYRAEQLPLVFREI